MIPGVQELRDVFDSLDDAGASVVLLEAEVGRGKTYAIQNFYDGLASEFTGLWIPGMAPADLPGTTGQLMRDRKIVQASAAGPITKDAPFLWFGTCAEIEPYSDSAALELMDQIDIALLGHGFNATAAYSKILGELAVDLALDLAQIGTLKTLLMAAKDIAVTTSREIGSWERHQRAYERRARSKALEKALATLEAHRRRPTVVVLDDAHLAQRPILEMLSCLLVPGVGSVEEPSFFPVGVARREDPVMVIVAARPHAFLAPQAASGEFNRWLTGVQQTDIPFTRIAIPDGLTVDAASQIARGTFRGAREERIATLVGQPIGAGMVNPLVLRQRMVLAAGFVAPANRADINALDAVQIDAFPTSPLDQVRELVDALSLGERSLVAQLSKFGSSCPWALLSDDPAASPDEVLQQSLESGLLKTSSPDGSVDLTAVYLWDDLTLAYFTDPMALVRMTPTESEDRLVARCHAWLVRLGRSTTTGARFAGVIGAMITRIAPVLGDPWSRENTRSNASASRKRGQAIGNYFRANAERWDLDELLTATMWVLTRQSLINDSVWSGLTSSRPLRGLFDRLPDSLVCRMIALNDRTMPQPNHLSTLRRSVGVDGPSAVWRLGEVVPLVKGEKLSAVLDEVSRDFPSLDVVAAEVRAYEDSAASYVDFWRNSASGPTLESAWLLANAYSALDRDYEAIGTLLPFRDDYNACLRIARLYVRVNEYDRASMVLEAFPGRPYGFAEKLADLQAAVGNFPAAIRLVEPYCEANNAAIAKKAQYLSKSGEPEAALALLESREAVDHHFKEFITVLRSRVTGVDRVGLRDHAEALWRAGERAASIASLQDHLNDSATLALWAEYKAADGAREDALAVIAQSLSLDPRLADTYVELALEDPETAHRWVNPHRASTHHRVQRGLLRLDWLLSDTISLGDWLATRSDVSTEVLSELVEIPSGDSVKAIKQTAVAVERAGDPLWAIDILGKQLSNWEIEGQYARLLVDYGLWDRAEVIFATTRNNSRDMCVAQAMWCLANSDLDGAGNRMMRITNTTPQLERLAELLPRVADPFQTIRAWRLALQLHLFSLAVAILGAGPRDDIQVERAYNSHRMAQPNHRRAYSRLRRRYAIRGARPDAGLSKEADGTAFGATE